MTVTVVVKVLEVLERHEVSVHAAEKGGRVDGTRRSEDVVWCACHCLMRQRMSLMCTDPRLSNAAGYG